VLVLVLPQPLPQPSPQPAAAAQMPAKNCMTVPPLTSDPSSPGTASVLLTALCACSCSTRPSTVLRAMRRTTLVATRWPAHGVPETNVRQVQAAAMLLSGFLQDA
jgi:hypothetical protein